MEQYFTLAVGMILLPPLYAGGMWFCRSSFEKEQNQRRKPFRTVPEFAVIVMAETAFARIWQTHSARSSLSEICFLFIMLSAMTIFCMTDYWEQIVPNRLLFLLLILFAVWIGFWGMQDIDAVIRMLPAVLLGFLFSVLCFGVGYLLSHGSMGAGDVKLAVIMGLYLTGDYVVEAVLYGCIIAAGFSAVQLLRKKLTRKDRIPFVPFLYLGLIIRYLAG